MTVGNITNPKWLNEVADVNNTYHVLFLLKYKPKMFIWY